MIQTVTQNAYAKVNLTLDVLYKREDGYHELSTIMARTGLCDEVTLTRAADIRVFCDVPLPEENTAVRAARLFQARKGSGGAHIRIRKRIPSEAGLGGASADAAAVLRGMAALYGGEDGTLFELARAVGADVPFCLWSLLDEKNAAALCTGVGERIAPLPAPARPLPVLIRKGEAGVSTAALFGALKLPVAHPDTARALAAWNAGDAGALAAALGNALEGPAVALCPEIGAQKAALMRAGALGASMSGSGAAVFGIFESTAAARAATSAAAFAFCTEIC